jgi:hypothetical protein
VFYICDQCGKPFTLNKKSVYDRDSNEVFCSMRCFELFKLENNKEKPKADFN